MPDRINLEKIRQQLEDERADLVARLGRDPAGTGTGQPVNPNKSDLAQAYIQRDRNTALAGNMEETLDQIDSALQRLEAGTYGVCTRCGEPIAVERLVALPYAELCIQCQRDESAMT